VEKKFLSSLRYEIFSVCILNGTAQVSFDLRLFRWGLGFDVASLDAFFNFYVIFINIF
jgi:hypothetical protein